MPAGSSMPATIRKAPACSARLPVSKATASRDVVATAAAHTRWCLSQAIIEDEKDPEIDFASLGEAPTTLFYGVPHDLVKPFAPYLRLFTTAMLRPLFRAAQGAGAYLPQRIFRHGPGAGD